MRAAKSKKGDDVTEEQLLDKDVITPDDIVKLDKITKSEFPILLFAMACKRAYYLNAIASLHSFPVAYVGLFFTSFVLC